jgi:hypothetical protein
VGQAGYDLNSDILKTQSKFTDKCVLFYGFVALYVCIDIYLIEGENVIRSSYLLLFSFIV